MVLWPPGRTYKSPLRRPLVSVTSTCGSICSQSPLIELETESLGRSAKGKDKRGRRESACVARKRKRETIASRESKTRSEEIILHSSRVYQHKSVTTKKFENYFRLLAPSLPQTRQYPRVQAVSESAVGVLSCDVLSFERAGQVIRPQPAMSHQCSPLASPHSWGSRADLGLKAAGKVLGPKRQAVAGKSSLRHRRALASHLRADGNGGGRQAQHSASAPPPAQSAGRGSARSGKRRPHRWRVRHEGV